MSVDGSVKVISSSLYSVIFTSWETRTSLILAAADFKVDYVQAGICLQLDLPLWAETVHFFCKCI